MALALPAVSASNAGFTIHRARFGEANQFESPVDESVETIDTDTLRDGGVLVERSAERVRLALDLDPANVGRAAPLRRRTVFSPRLLECSIIPGTWSRARYNFRYSNNGWWYESVVANVAYDRRLDPGMFLETPPAQTLTELADLF